MHRSFITKFQLKRINWSCENNNNYCQVFSRGQKSVREWITEWRMKAYELSDKNYEETETWYSIAMGLAMLDGIFCAISS